MAPTSRSSNTAYSWTSRENKLFEDTLAQYDHYTEECWLQVARVVGKSTEEVKMHFKLLVDDINKIESGRVPYPYRSST